MKLKSAHHTGFVVANLEKSIDFYTQVLGLKLAIEPSPWAEGPGLDLGLGVSGARIRSASIAVGTSTLIELVEFGHSTPAVSDPKRDGLRTAHMCFEVDNAVETRQELIAKGVRFTSEVNEITEGPQAGWKWVYFLDPDDITLELIEINKA
jgi:catechol 2,3-dioxygenase-like lactoylglutathione lyase family enzyme